jgi:hypothetical protein
MSRDLKLIQFPTGEADNRNYNAQVKKLVLHLCRGDEREAEALRVKLIETAEAWKALNHLFQVLVVGKFQALPEADKPLYNEPKMNKTHSHITDTTVRSLHALSVGVSAQEISYDFFAALEQEQKKAKTETPK